LCSVVGGGRAEGGIQSRRTTVPYRMPRPRKWLPRLPSPPVKQPSKDLTKGESEMRIDGGSVVVGGRAEGGIQSLRTTMPYRLPCRRKWLPLLPLLPPTPVKQPPQWSDQGRGWGMRIYGYLMVRAEGRKEGSIRQTAMAYRLVAASGSRAFRHRR
jgi:hypothetical protein